MDTVKYRKQVFDFFQKYKFAILVLLLGMGLMLICPKEKTEMIHTASTQPTIEDTQSLQDELSVILSQIQGAGKVSVLLTVSAGAETIFQLDEDQNVTDTESSRQSNTVLITDGQREQQGLIRQVNPEAYRGAVVVCEGGDDPTVRLRIVEAVSKATGLGADRISVLKMK